MNSKDSAGNKTVFEIEFCTANKRTNSGGKIIKLARCILTGHNSNMNRNKTINVRQLNSSYHYTNIHIRLILSFNGKNIAW